MARFKPGQSGNPRGRPKGSRHRLTERFLAELADDFEKHGAATIEACRVENPVAYIRIIASLVAKQEVEQVNPFDEWTDEELQELERCLLPRRAQAPATTTH